MYYQRKILEHGLVLEARKELAGDQRIHVTIDIHNPKNQKIINNVSIIIRDLKENVIYSAFVGSFTKAVDGVKIDCYQIRIYEEYLLNSAISIDLKFSENDTSYTRVDYDLKSLHSSKK